MMKIQREELGFGSRNGWTTRPNMDWGIFCPMEHSESVSMILLSWLFQKTPTDLKEPSSFTLKVPKKTKGPKALQCSLWTTTRRRSTKRSCSSIISKATYPILKGSMTPQFLPKPGKSQAAALLLVVLMIPKAKWPRPLLSGGGCARNTLWSFGFQTKQSRQFSRTKPKSSSRWSWAPCVMSAKKKKGASLIWIPRWRARTRKWPKDSSTQRTLLGQSIQKNQFWALNQENQRMFG